VTCSDNIIAAVAENHILLWSWTHDSLVARLANPSAHSVALHGFMLSDFGFDEPGDATACLLVAGGGSQLDTYVLSLDALNSRVESAPVTGPVTEASDAVLTRVQTQKGDGEICGVALLPDRIVTSRGGNQDNVVVSTLEYVASPQSELFKSAEESQLLAFKANGGGMHCIALDTMALAGGYGHEIHAVVAVETEPQLVKRYRFGQRFLRFFPSCSIIFPPLAISLSQANRTFSSSLCLAARENGEIPHGERGTTTFYLGGACASARRC
jgi:hypothetical protein